MLIQVQGGQLHHGGYIHAGSVSSSMQFDKIRYQNLSKLQTGRQDETGLSTRKQFRNTQSLPRKSQMGASKYNDNMTQMTISTNNSRIPKFLNKGD